MVKTDSPNDYPIRLNRYLANCGIASRRKAEQLINQGKIKVNGKTVTDLSTQVHFNDQVFCNGRKVTPEPFIYLMLNKPKNTLTTKHDPGKRQTVYNYLEGPNLPQIFPIGRLDRNTSGVLLFTNDGQLANNLMHPKKEIEKVYQVKIDHPLPQSTVEKMAQPQYVDNDFIAPNSLVIPNPSDKKRILLGITSGQNRIVRRLFKKWGFNVKNLDRLSFAGLKKNHLKLGRWRYLKQTEVNIIRNKAGL
jgi:23S rRNA pseudouridine2605 synthase